MKTILCRYFIPAFVVILAVIIFPFLPGKYDPVAQVLSAFFQICCGLGLLTLIPASLWLLRNIRYPADVVPKDLSLLKRRIFFKIYYWMTIVIVLVAIVLTGFGISLTFGIAAVISLAYLSVRIWRKFADHHSHHLLFSKCLPASLALLPVLLVVFQMLLNKPLTNWSRDRAIRNSIELIAEIERYNERNGNYPLSLNAVYKDYLPGVAGIEEYFYTYDDHTFNICFEQPRFFFDRIGTREFVVYNPDGRHRMMSHAVWNMIMQTGAGQGWYEWEETGQQGWKIFYFD